MLDQLNRAEKLIAVLAAAGLAYTSFKANTIGNDVAEQNVRLGEIERQRQLELQSRKDARETTQQQSELAHKVFQEFVSAVTDRGNDPAARLDRLEGVLVLTYALSDARLQEGMARAVQQSIERLKPPTAALASRAREASFDAEQLLLRASSEQKALAAPAAPSDGTDKSRVRWSNYDFDVFWCEGRADSAELQARAEAITALKSTDPQASGRWRTRPLPVNVNTRAGFNIQQYEVRYSSADEKPLADALGELIRKKYPAETVVTKQTRTDTPYYLSAFVCKP